LNFLNIYKVFCVIVNDIIHIDVISIGDFYMYKLHVQINLI